MKIKIRCFKRYSERKKIITTPLKFVADKFERNAALHLSEQSDELFANFIQETALDCNACSNHSLLF